MGGVIAAPDITKGGFIMTKYTLFIDDNETKKAVHIGILKNEADFWLNHCNGFFAAIYRGKKCYATKERNEKKWKRWY